MIRPTAEYPHQCLTRGLVIGMAHVAQQHYRLVWPHHDGVAQAGSEEVFQIGNFDPPREGRDVYYAHVRTPGPACIMAAAPNRPPPRQSIKTTPVSGKSSSGVRLPC